MKLTFKRISVMLAMIIAASMVFVSCKKDGDKDQSQVKVQIIKLSDKALGMLVGDTKTITAEVLPADAKNKSLTWTSSDNSVATVSEGKVTAVKVGECIITAAAKDGSNVKAECKITVTDKAIPVESVEFSVSTLGIAVGETAELNYTIYPETATNKEVTWSSSNEAAATVENGKVKAIAIGTTDITVTTVDGEKTATCTVTVKAAPVKVASVSLEPTEATIVKGGELTLKYTVLPEDADNKEVTWSSSQESVATVTNGKVNAIAAGETVITVTTVDGEKTATCKVTVSAEAFFQEPDENLKSGTNALPAYRVAEKNLYCQSELSVDVFASGNNTQYSSYYKSSMVGSKVRRGNSITINEENYHIPSADEFRGILPAEDLKITDVVNKSNVEETIQIGKSGASVVYYADYKNNTNGITLGDNPEKSVMYAIKMKPKNGSDYSKMCAYRYQWKQYGKEEAHLEIQVKYLGEAGKAVSIAEVASESFWAKSNVTVRLDACGRLEEFSTESAQTSFLIRNYDSKETKECAETCYYWTSSLTLGATVLDPITDVWGVKVNGTEGLISKDTNANEGRPIRLFR